MQPTSNAASGPNGRSKTARCDRAWYKYLKANTSKKRTLSLYRQGLYWYACIPTMREEWLVRLMDAYECILRQERLFNELLAME